MQGMLIQEMSAVADQPRPQQAQSSKESPEQSFGEVLVAAEPQDEPRATGKQGEKSCRIPQEDRTKLPLEAAAEAVAASTALSVEDQANLEFGTTSSPREKAEPFLMAALGGESANFVTPSPQAKRVAAAERLQELIARWLQTQDQESGFTSEISAEQPSATEVPDGLKVALQQLTDTVPNEGADEQPPELSDNDLEELKQLMAAVQQPNAIAEAETASEVSTETGVSLAAEVSITAGTGQPSEVLTEAAISQVSPLSQDTGPKTCIHQETPAATPKDNDPSTKVVAATPEAVATEPQAEPRQQVEQTASRGGLQEEQLARIATPHKDGKSETHQHQLQAEARTESKTEATTETRESKPHPTLEARSEHQPVSFTEGQLDKGATPEKSALAHEKLQTLMPGNSTQPTPVENGPQTLVPGQRIMQLPSGLQLSEGQLVDQVVTHLAGSHDGESGRMRLKLHPAELGSLRLDLIVEGDRVRAHLQAQNQQVQEVLDRHLPQLREALQQQGLKIDEFRVDVQQGQEQAQDQAQAWYRQQQQGRSSQPPWQAEDWPQELEVPLGQLLQPAAGGISLRV